MRYPVNKPFRISTPYGWVKGYPLHTNPNDPIIPASEKKKYPGKGYGFHTGIDIVAEGSETTVATHKGALTTGYDSANGNWSAINDGKYRSFIAHQEKHTKRSGSVSEGQAIGKQGETGYADGEHVHLGVRVNGVMVDPESIIKTGDTNMDYKLRYEKATRIAESRAKEIKKLKEQLAKATRIAESRASRLSQIKDKIVSFVKGA